MNSIRKFTGRFCFVEMMTMDIQNGYIGTPAFWEALRAHRPVQGPFRRSPCEGPLPLMNLDETRVRSWLLEQYPTLREYDEVRVRGSERYYKHPVDLWVERYLHLRQRGVPEKEVQQTVVAEIEREKREYQFEQFVQMEQAAELGVPWRNERERIMSQYGVVEGAMTEHKAEMQAFRMEQLRYRAELLLGLEREGELVASNKKEERFMESDEFRIYRYLQENEKDITSVREIASHYLDTGEIPDKQRRRMRSSEEE
eukprot:CAMPEP_0119145324 /NCGR_PEP_ID=MMETSP1310-20130426/37325_1 /TAXON_ID=464262 /ORGANISM="Genus nov. species nov., Strain RCC2339" /LENGTH=255 /DNA_ID=CAMNT_0007137131 /DNA_START=27 /DNA_END=791 /DNA_ORIENTATION=-